MFKNHVHLRGTVLQVLRHFLQKQATPGIYYFHYHQSKQGKTREVLLDSALAIFSQAGSICDIIHLLSFKGKMGDERSPQVKPMIRR